MLICVILFVVVYSVEKWEKVQIRILHYSRTFISKFSYFYFYFFKLVFIGIYLTVLKILTLNIFRNLVIEQIFYLLFIFFSVIDILHTKCYQNTQSNIAQALSIFSCKQIKHTTKESRLRLSQYNLIPQRSEAYTIYNF